MIRLLLLILNSIFIHSFILNPLKGPFKKKQLFVSVGPNIDLNRPTNPRSGAYSFEYWSKAFKSQLNEFDYDIQEIEGAIPENFVGTLFRSMPSRFERAKTSYGHYLDGDGYIGKLSIKNGKARFKSKFVRTKEFQEEERENKVLYRSTFRTQKETSLLGNAICINNAFDLKLKNVANTNCQYWAGRLMVFFEAGIPYRICPKTLDTVGEDSMGIGMRSGISVTVPILRDFNEEIHDSIFGSSMTAHPKIDSARQTFVGWSWQAEVDPSRGPLDTNPRLSIYEWNQDMKPIGHMTSHKLESTSVSPHDFSLTPNHYVFIENRVTGNTLPYVLGTKCPAQCVDIEPLEPMVLNIVKRPPLFSVSSSSTSSVSESFRVNLSPGFTIHSVCSFETPSRTTSSNKTGGGISNTLELFTTAWKSEEVASGTVKGGLLGSWEGAAPVFDDIPVTLLYRTVVDLDTKELKSHAPVVGMEETIVEHPHVNPDFEGKVVRYIYMSVGSVEGISSPPLGYLRLDLTSGEKQEWYAPEHTYCEELVIIPKVDGAGKEDACWLLASMFDAVKNKSCIGIFDGENVSIGPICRLWLSHHLPHSLHGCFTKEIFDARL